MDGANKDSKHTPYVLQKSGPRGLLNLFFSFNPIGFAARDKAFVFPTLSLAHRFAEYELQRGCHCALDAVPGAPPSTSGAPNACMACGCCDSVPCPGGCQRGEGAPCSACVQQGPIEMWIVYQNPSDYPGSTVARRNLGLVPTTEVMIEPALAALRNRRPAHLVRLPRDPTDDPNIIESWV